MNEIIYHGTYTFDDMPYRKLMCAMIQQSINHARGIELSDILDQNDPNFNRRRGEERAAAIEYLLSDEFQFDAELLGIDDYVDRIRKMVTNDDYQMPIFRMITDEEKEEIRQEWKPRKVTQKSLAQKYGVSQQRIGMILQARLFERQEVNV